MRQPAFGKLKFGCALRKLVCGQRSLAMRISDAALSAALIAVAMITSSANWKTASAATSEDIPKVTRDFLTFCAASSENFVLCSEDVQFIDISLGMGLYDKSGFKRSCQASFVPGPKLTTYVTDWLAAHPETSEQERFKSVAEALATLYPCPD
jgi:hypothetical protein